MANNIHDVHLGVPRPNNVSRWPLFVVVFGYLTSMIE